MIERMVVRLVALLLCATPLAGQTAKEAPQGGFEVGDQILPEVEGDTQFTRGLTIDVMGLRTGDRIVVPRRNDTERTVRIVGILVSIPIAILGIRQLTR